MRATQARPRQSGPAVIRSIVPLALWRWRQTWQLLLVTGLGITSAVVIACAAPLFLDVALTAGVRNVLTASPQAAQIALQANTIGLATQLIADDKVQLGKFMQAELGAYLSSYSQFTLQTPGFDIATPGPDQPGGQMFLTGVSMPQAASHLRLIQGRLPRSSGPDLEVVLTPRSATDLRVSVGSTVPLWVTIYAAQSTSDASQQYRTTHLLLHIVGIVDIDTSDPFWHAQGFNPVRAGFSTSFRAIMSSDAFLAVMTRLAREQGGTMIQFLVSPSIIWYFFLDAARVTIGNLDDLIAHLSGAQVHLAENAAIPPNLRNSQLASLAMKNFGAPSSLERFRARIPIIRIPIAILTLLALALTLFFVSIAARSCVERQARSIALLHSRGASRRQLFCAFALPAGALGLLALLIGPLLALLLVHFLTSQTLAPADQSAISSVTGNPIQAALSLRWYALLTVAGALSATGIALWWTLQQDAQTARRDSACPLLRPVWQRLRLDMMAAVIALSGYSASLFMLYSGTSDARTNQVIFLPLSLVGPIFLLIAALLFFLRLFPPLLRFIFQRVARWLSAPLLVALAQLSRAPHQLTRMLLLTLAVSFTFLALAFNASETQQINNAAAQQVGADFSGIIPIPFGSHPMASRIENTYRAIPGVLSATVGYAADAVSSESSRVPPLQIRAVNTSTFAQTAIWTDQDSSQSLPRLLAQISAPAQSGETGLLAVPALVDSVAWNALRLTPGARFHLNITGSVDFMTFEAVAEVHHIPTINDSLQTSGDDEYTTPGGILVDLNLYTQAYEQLNQDQDQPGTLAPLNFIWLRTSDTAAALAEVRAALTSGPLSLIRVYDRRAMIAQMQQDPHYLTVSVALMLDTGIITLLALVGGLFATWQHINNRLNSFSVLRALGGTQRQITRILLWEQGFIYLVALALGVVSGALLIFTVVPGLVFTNLTPPGTGITDAEFFVIQHVLPVQIVLPPTLGIVGIVLTIICALLLFLMSKIAVKRWLGQRVRLAGD